MLRTVLIAALVAVALAEAPFRPPQSLCKGDHYSWKDYSSRYAANFSGSSLCIFSDYEEECPTIDGLVGCDRYNSICVEYVGDETWKAAAAGSNYLGNAKPKACVSQGAFWFPDSRVVSVAQVLGTSFFAIWGVLVVIVACRGGVNILAVIALLLMLPAAIVLTVSYYYLNAIIILAASFAAIGLFSERTPVFASLGMVCGLLALFWVTYDAGLGSTQHHDRRMAGSATQDTFEAKCDNYYRNYFVKAPVYLGDDENPFVVHTGYCGRAFVAGELFVMILLELLLILVVASGAWSLGIKQDEEKKEEEAPVAAAAAENTATTSS
jgi:hypothetical protein